MDSPQRQTYMLCAPYLPTQGQAASFSMVVGRRAATAAGERSHTDRVIRREVRQCTFLWTKSVRKRTHWMWQTRVGVFWLYYFSPVKSKLTKLSREGGFMKHTFFLIPSEAVLGSSSVRLSLD